MAVVPLRRVERRARTTMDDVMDVFEYWRVVCGHSMARLDNKRELIIRERLADGYEVEHLRLAIEGCALSPFHQGHNDRRTVYDSVTLILRDADHVDRFMEIAARARARLAEQAQAKEQDAAPRTMDEAHVREHLDRMRRALRGMR